jgi:hypothetical protein
MYILTPDLSSYLPGSAQGALLTGKLALARNALVRLGNALDPIFKLAVPLGQLLGHHIAALGGAPLRGPCSEPHSLACSKPVLGWWMAFRAHARILTQRQGVPVKGKDSSPWPNFKSARMDWNRMGQPMFIPN